MRLNPAVCFLAVLGLVTGLCTAQEPTTSELLLKIQQLESRAMARDLTIADLQSQLTNVGSSHLAISDLESSINALTDDFAEGNVTAPKSERLRISGQLRLRGEYRNPESYKIQSVAGAPSTYADDDTDFVLQRTRLNFDFDVVEDVRVFVQLQDTRYWGSEGGPTVDQAGIDLHQGYVEFNNLFGNDWGVRVGRMALSLGDQRFVSPLDWHGVGRSFDGVLTWWKGDAWSLHAFSVIVNESSMGSTGTATDDRIMDGLYFGYTGLENHELDLFLFHRRLNDDFLNPTAGTPGDLDDWTLGARFKGKSGGFNYSAEGAYQFGDRAGLDVDSYGWAFVAGYNFGGEMNPTISVEWDFASGDESGTDGEYNTFDPLFPFGHAYQGYMDLFAWRNGHDIVVKFGIDATEDLWLGAALHWFILDEENDSWYNAGGAAIRTSALAGIDDSVGQELDLHGKYKVNDAVALWFGYSHFFAGGYVDDTDMGTNGNEDADWVFLQMTVNF